MISRVEHFDSLDDISGIVACFLSRVDGLDLNVEREEALKLLAPIYADTMSDEGFDADDVVYAEQVHENTIYAVGRDDLGETLPDCDGLMTDKPGVPLGVYVADCAAIYLVDPVHHAIALLHSGRKGTESEILRNAVEMMEDEYGTHPGDLVMVISPCIRPPHYEVDIAGMIREQAETLGIKNIEDSGECTASNLKRYYSYRMEKGKTGRMLALLQIEE
ncbi:MAG: polyphenol oxidase family protein [Chthoniobacterales bacterium]